MKLMLSTLALLMSCFSVSFAGTWVVHADGTGDAPTIQAGIDSAAAGDTVLLANGTYTGVGNRDVDFLGKAITVSSQSGDPNVCIIDCQGTGADPHRGFQFQNHEGPLSVLSGVTITNGNQELGGGILCMASSPTVSHCRILENTGFLGGGFYCEGSSPAFAQCVFRSNSAYQGAGANCENASSVTFTESIFAENVASTVGGAILCGMSSTVTLNSCTLVSNEAGGGGAGISLQVSGASLDHSIIALSSAGSAIQCSGPSAASLVCCDIYGNAGGDWTGCIASQVGTNGNFSADPQFCGILGTFNYYLQSDSPCATVSCGLVGAFPVGCGLVRTETRTWGTVKAIYR